MQFVEAFFYFYCPHHMSRLIQSNLHEETKGVFTRVLFEEFGPLENKLWSGSLVVRR